MKGLQLSFNVRNVQRGGRWDEGEKGRGEGGVVFSRREN